MRFNLEPGGAFCDGKNKLVTVKINGEEGTFKKVCQAAFLVQLNFQSIWKENIKLRHS